MELDTLNELTMSAAIKKAIIVIFVAFLSYSLLFLYNVQEAKADSFANTMFAQNRKLALSEAARMSDWSSRYHPESHRRLSTGNKSTSYFHVDDRPRFEAIDPTSVMDDGFWKGKSLGYKIGRGIRGASCHTLKLGCY